MKSKWNLVKLKQEMDAKVAADKKIEDLNHEIQELSKKIPKTDEQQRNVVSDAQLMEQQATLILLKHKNEEKEKKIDSLESRIFNLQKDLNKVNSENEKMLSDNQFLLSESDKFKDEISELQHTLDREVLKVAELQAKVYEFESMKTQLTL